VGQRYDGLLCQVHFNATDYPTGTKGMAEKEASITPHNASTTDSMGEYRFAQFF
jgi:hypothetical protein